MRPQYSPQMVSERIEGNEIGEKVEPNNKEYGGETSMAAMERNHVPHASNGVAHGPAGVVDNKLNGKDSRGENGKTPPREPDVQAYLNGKGDVQRRTSNSRGGRGLRGSRENRRSNSDDGRNFGGAFFNPPPELGRSYSYDQYSGGGYEVAPGLNGPPQAPLYQSPSRAPHIHRRSISEHFDCPPVYAQPPMLEPIIAGEQLHTDVSHLPSNRTPIARRSTQGGGGRPSYGAIGHGGDRRRYGSADDAKLFHSARNLGAKAASERQFTGRGELQNFAENFSPTRSFRGLPTMGSPPFQQDFAAPPSPLGNAHPLLGNTGGSPSMRALPSPRMTGAYGPDLSGSEMEPFLAQNFGNQTPPRQDSLRRQPSSRRTHMRHRSAQLFMSKTKGEKQPKSCRDLFCAIMFLIQFVAMIGVAVYFGPDAMASAHSTGRIDPAEDADGTTVVVEYSHLLQLAVFCGLFACALSGLALFFMALFSKEVIKICLIASIALSFAWGTIGIGLRPSSFMPITGVIVLALCVGYAFVVWNRIPFAAANLRTGLAGVKSCPGVAVVAYLFQAIALGWSILWVFAALGVFNVIHGCGNENSLCQTRYHYGIMAAFLVSYYWTLQVFTYTVQVIVAGSIENWWSEKDLSGPRSCCPKNVRENFGNAMTYNFGSVCYGSLLVGPVQTIRQVAEPLRPKDQPSLLFLNQMILPLQRLLFSWIDAAVIHCNQWAFAYLGMYHYKFMEAGQQATDLLETRGWSNIANDDLLGNVLYMFGLVIGGCTGCFAVMMEEVDHYQIASNSDQATLAFFAGLLIGLVLSNVLMSAVTGAVNAVIICFAENPWDFQVNHPELCSEMNLAWSTVWPGCLTGQQISGSERDLLRPSLRPWDMAV